MKIICSTEKQVIKFYNPNFLQAQEEVEAMDTHHAKVFGEICVTYLGRRKFRGMPAEALLIASPCVDDNVHSKIEFYDWCQQLIGRQTNPKFRGDSMAAEAFCKEVKENNLSNVDIYNLALSRSQNNGSERDA